MLWPKTYITWSRKIGGFMAHMNKIHQAVKRLKCKLWQLSNAIGTCNIHKWTIHPLQNALPLAHPLWEPYASLHTSNLPLYLSRPSIYIILPKTDQRKNNFTIQGTCLRTLNVYQGEGAKKFSHLNLHSQAFAKKRFHWSHHEINVANTSKNVTTLPHSNALT